MGEEGKEMSLEQEEDNDDDNSQVGNEPSLLLPVVRYDDFALLDLRLRPSMRTLPRAKCSSASCRRWQKSGGG